MESINQYAAYLMQALVQINQNAKNGSIYLRLNNFLETGEIKDVIKKKDSDKMKIEILNSISDSVRHFAKTQKSSMNVKTYQEFNNK